MYAFCKNIFLFAKFSIAWQQKSNQWANKKVFSIIFLVLRLLLYFLFIDSFYSSCSSNRKMCITLVSLSFFLALLDTRPSAQPCLTVNFLAIVRWNSTLQIYVDISRNILILKIYHEMNVAVFRIKIFCNNSQIISIENLNHIFLNNE